MIFSYSTGRFTASITDATYIPRIKQTAKPPVLYCHGTGTTTVGYQSNDPSSASGIRRILRFLVNRGHIVVSPTCPNLWGNPTARSRCADALNYAYSLGAIGPAIGIGYSQGGVPLLKSIELLDIEHSISFACGIGLLGAIDMELIRDEDIASQRAPIDAAWGVTYPDSLPAGANPADNTAKWNGFPLQWWYVSNDPLIAPSSVTDFAAATGMEIYDVGALGHSDAAVLAVNLDNVEQFITTHTG